MGKEFLLSRGFNRYTLALEKKGVFVVKVSLPSGINRSGVVVR